MTQGWAAAMSDPQAFAAEQARLAHVWTFLGFTDQLRKEGDWMRADLAGRSVFVQRYKGMLKGFENLCAHRFHPIRTAEAGNGAIVCGFHLWRYDGEGRMVGAPNCQEVFGALPAELNKRLGAIEISTCGEMVFGRFPGEEISLRAWLGQAYPILAALSKATAPRDLAVRKMAANWRLFMHISFDDYHIVAIHPTTFGKRGHQKPADIGYWPIGPHSCRMRDRAEDAVPRMARECADGSWKSDGYRIFQIFPNLVISHFEARDQHWYINVQQVAPLAHDRSELRSWIYPAPFAPKHPRPAHDRWSGPLLRRLRERIIRRVSEKVAGEDIVACEAQQAVAGQVETAPVLGALETRMVWFEDAYAEVMARPPSARFPAR